MKRILAVLLCISLLMVVCPLMAFAAENEDSDFTDAGYEEFIEEYGENHADAEDPYLEGGTVYDLENESDSVAELEEPIEEPDREPGDDDSDIYTDESFDADNAEQLQGDYILNEIIIKFKEPWQVPGKEKQLQHEIEKVESIGFVEGLGVYVVRVDDLDKNPNAVLNRFKNNKYIEYVEPNYSVSLEYIPNDAYYKLFQTRAMDDLNAPAGWDIIKGSSGAVVAVIDSGVAANPDLPPLWSGYSATSGLSYTNDKLSHGTAVAGVIGAIGDNGLGGAGLNWSASIMAVKVDDAAGSLPIANVAKGIIWAADNGAKIINLSLGTTSDSITLKNAIDYAYNKGCAIFAATGNAGTGSIDYPARYPNVMAVGSSASGTSRAPTSNYGSGIDVLGLSSFFTTQASGGTGNSAGTSFASPQAAGLASLIWGLNPKLTNAQVYDLIRQGASGGGRFVNNEVGYGLINIGKTLELTLATISGPPATTTPTPQTPAPEPVKPETPQEVRTPPVITLTGFSSMTLEYGQAYTEMGYSAVDCKGVNLTNSVKVTNNVNVRTAGLYTVTYEVSDSTGLSARATRTVTVSAQPVAPPPPTAPKITIIGSNPIVLHQTSSTPYREQSARAIDSDGTDISNQVVVTGTVNRTVAGTYTITYTVTSPTTNLSASTSRNVRIVAPTERKDPRTSYGFSGQAKEGGKVTHTGIVSGALGFMDLQVTSIDKNMTISVQLINTATKQAVLTDTFTAAGTKQYKIDEGKYELAVTVTKANGNSKYDIKLLMPETVATLYFDEVEVPLFGLPQIAPIGSNPIILHIGGTPYTEQGARAVDFLGNDISDSIVVEGAPDTSVAGTYVITYTVLSAAGVPVSVTRDVRILDPNDETTILEDEVPLADLPTIEYIVEKGDSLWSISQKFYGTGKEWFGIYDMNADVIGPIPGNLRVGMVLTIRLR